MASAAGCSPPTRSRRTWIRGSGSSTTPRRHAFANGPFRRRSRRLWGARASRRPGSSRPSGCRAFATSSLASTNSCAARASIRRACPTPARPCDPSRRRTRPRSSRRSRSGAPSRAWPHSPRLLAAYDDGYRKLKAERSGADFADLELRALELLSGSGPVAEAWRTRFTHLMVDEFQDTNRVQLELINALRGPETRLFVVGDEYQSIYRFRHADLEVFREQRAPRAPTRKWTSSRYAATSGRGPRSSPRSTSSAT